MTLLLTRVLKIIGEIILIAVVLAAIILGVVRSLFPYVDRYRAVFEQWGSSAVHHPVKIGKVTAVWQGFYPEFRLDNVEVLDTQTQQPLLQVHRLQVGVDIFGSLFSQRLVPSSFSVSDTHLFVHQVDAENIAINNLNFNIADHAAQNPDVPGILNWLLKQGDIQFNNVAIDWQDPSSRVFQFTNVTLQLTKGFFHHRIIGLATLLADAPTRFRFVVNLNEVGPNKQNVRADLYLYIRDFDIAPWVQNYLWHDFAITAGHLERLQLWATWQDKQWQRLQGVVKLKRAVINTPQLAKPLQLDEVSANIAWQHQREGFTAAADQIRLVLNQQTLPLTQFTLWQQAANKNPVVQTYAIDHLDVAQLQQIATDFGWLPTAAQTPLLELQPQATIHDLVLRREWVSADNANISTRFSIENLRTNAWQHIPAIDGLSADVQLTPTAGNLQLTRSPVQLDFGELFGHALELNDESGTVQWLQRDDGWKIQANNLQLANSDVGLRMQLSLLLPADGGTPFIELHGGFAERDASQIRNYLPVGLMKSVPALSEWLHDAFIAGDGVEAQVLLQGPLSHFPFDDHSGHFEIRAQVHNMDFNYKTGWPRLSGLDADLLFNDRSLDIQASNASIMGLPTGSIHGVIKNLAHAQLDVEGNVAANTQVGLNFIAQSPLHESLGGILDNLSMSGPMQLNLALQIPFYAGNNGVKVQGQVMLSPGTVAVPAWGVQLTDVNGVFQFTEESLTAQKLIAKWLGLPVTMQISTKVMADSSHAIRTQFSGRAVLNVIKKYYAFGALKDKLQGETNYLATLLLTKKDDKTQAAFMVDSDLKGIAIDLPTPLKKLAAEQTPTHFEVDFVSNTAMSLSLQYAKQFSAILSLVQSKTKNWLLNAGNIRFGSQPAVAQTASGLLIDGHLSQFVWSDFAAYLQPWLAAKSADKKTTAISLRKLDVTFDKASVFGVDLSAANVQAQSQANGWHVQIDSPTVAGKLDIPADLSQQAIVGDFSQFHYVPGTSNNATNLNPADLPALNVTFHNFYYGDKPFGAITLVTAAMDNGLQIQKLNLDQGKTHVTTTGRWQRSAEGHEQTTLSGNVHSEDIGSTLTAWGITGSVVGGTGNAAFALSWPAAPYNFTMAQVNGNFSNAFTRGRIININQTSATEMGIGRILNLLSLQSLPRRLSLDFSDLVQKGFSFDVMKGNFDIQNGNAVTNDALLEGSVAKVDMKGRIGLGAKDYDLTMMITPSVTSSLPLAATLVGGPIAGAATWLGSQVLSGVVNKMTQQSYQVTGSWDEPNITKGNEKVKAEN